jgi:hypothetical protein
MIVAFQYKVYLFCEAAASEIEQNVKCLTRISPILTFSR